MLCIGLSLLGYKKASAKNYKYSTTTATSKKIKRLSKKTKYEYVVRVDVQDAEFQYLLNNYSNLRGNSEASYNSKAVVKNYGGKDYIVVDTASHFSKTLVAFTEATEDKMLVISVINKKNTYDYELLEKFSVIINNSIE